MGILWDGLTPADILAARLGPAFVVEADRGVVTVCSVAFPGRPMVRVAEADLSTEVIAYHARELPIAVMGVAS